MTYPKHPCPKCGLPLEAAGELTFEGETLPVYQCDTCLEVRETFGEPLETYVTFYVKDGIARHPEDDPD